MLQDLMHEWKRASGLAAISLAGALAVGTGAASAQDVDTVRPASIHAGTCDSPGEVVTELNPLTVTFDDDDGSGTGGGATGDDDADADDGGTGDDNADDGITGDDTTDDGLDDNADDTGDDGLDDDADDSGDDDADDLGTGLTNMQAFQSSGNAGFVGAEDASIAEGSEDSDSGANLDALLANPHIVAVFESEGSDTIIACGSIGGFVSADDDNDLAVGLRSQNDSGFAGIAILDDDDDNNDLDVDVYIARDVV